MPAYIVADITPQDRDAYEKYRTLAAVAIEKYDGRYLVRGGKFEVFEGDWTPNIMIVLEFPDLDKARAWYNSPEYAEALQFRDQGLARNMILVEGMRQ